MSPPYWPYRCCRCSRFVSNPVVTFNVESILKERGDCSRCGAGVELVPLCWEDWFGEDCEPTGKLIEAGAR